MAPDFYAKARLELALQTGLALLSCAVVIGSVYLVFQDVAWAWWTLALGGGATTAFWPDGFGAEAVQRRVGKLTERYSIELVAHFTPSSRQGEPSAPWIARPGLRPTNRGWQMNLVEGHLHAFSIFWNGLAEGDRQDYFRRHDLGPDWPDRESWRRSLLVEWSP